MNLKRAAYGSPLETASARIVAGATNRGLLQDDKAGALQMPHDPTRRYPGRERLEIMDALSAAELKRECDAVGEIARLGGRELFMGHLRTIVGERERSKNVSKDWIGLPAHVKSLSTGFRWFFSR